MVVEEMKELDSSAKKRMDRLQHQALCLTLCLDHLVILATMEAVRSPRLWEKRAWTSYTLMKMTKVPRLTTPIDMAEEVEILHGGITMAVM